tara:strand:+ start:890 stop:1798 length:909 start_codon:yes stop_codon:yes gene_type:complete
MLEYMYMNSTENTPKNVPQHVEWTPDHENILVEWADKAMCYRWLHGKSHQYFSKANTWFTIPVIIMSTLTGTANFAQDKFEGSTRELVTVSIGAVNIFAGILTTIQQFLKISELNEAHRVSSLSWDKFYRNIKVDLAKAPSERTPVLQMLKTSKEEFDRLMEISPAISEKVAKEFTKTFSGGSNKGKSDIENELVKKQEAFGLLKKPDICGELESSKNSVYRPNRLLKDTINAIDNVRSNMNHDTKQKQIEKIIQTFKEQKLREPTNREILDELGDDANENTINNARSTISEKNVVINIENT